MTGFGDVNVGDKVRLTHKQVKSYRIEFIVEDKRDLGLDAGFVLNGPAGQLYEVGMDYKGGWVLEVLEPAPKPLPASAGVYTAVDCLYLRDEFGRWFLLGSGGYAERSVEHMRDIAPLMPLVPYSAVEEARTEVITEIVEWAQTWTVPMPFIASEIERKFLGGKA